MFKFNGDWKSFINLPAFKGFLRRKDPNTQLYIPGIRSGEIILDFEDDLSDRPDPCPAQFAALEYLENHQHEILKNVMDEIIKEIPQIITRHDLADDPRYVNLSPHTIKILIDFSTVQILIPSKEGISYMVLTGGCDWNRRGMSILIHKTRVINICEEPTDFLLLISIDHGTPDPLKDDKYAFMFASPQKYKPHPKYNKLKPSQEAANKVYESLLISNGHNAIFKDLIEKGELDVNQKKNDQDYSLLEVSIHAKNHEITEFLLKKGASIGYALYACCGDHTYNHQGMDLILAYGGDINQQDADANTT